MTFSHCGAAPRSSAFSSSIAIHNDQRPTISHRPTDHWRRLCLQMINLFCQTYRWRRTMIVTNWENFRWCVPSLKHRQSLLWKSSFHTKLFDEKSLEKKWWNWNQLDLFCFNDNKFSLSEVSDRWSASRAKMWWDRPILLAWKTSSTIGEGRISWAWYIFSFHEWLGKIVWLHKSAADDILGPKKEKCVVISVKACAYWIKPLNFDALWISQSITFMCRPE